MYRDASLAVLAKLVHMDALALAITVKPENMWMLYLVSAVRTLGEDVPQAWQQIDFVLWIRQNPFMIVGVIDHFPQNTF